MAHVICCEKQKETKKKIKIYYTFRKMFFKEKTSILDTQNLKKKIIQYDALQKKH